jgi:hypothetical protein
VGSIAKDLEKRVRFAVGLSSGDSHGDGASVTDRFWKGDALMGKRTAVAALGLALALLAFGLSSHLHAGPGGTNRPFKGHAEGEVTGVSPEGELIVESTGTATHLGKFTRTESVFVDGFDISGTIVFTAANGDQLWAGFAGEFTSPTTAEGTYTSVGGTGRFEDATGTAGFEVTTATTPDGVTHVVVTFEGKISY